jgi:hypothetical protein
LVVVGIRFRRDGSLHRVGKEVARYGGRWALGWTVTEMDAFWGFYAGRDYIKAYGLVVRRWCSA